MHTLITQLSNGGNCFKTKLLLNVAARQFLIPDKIMVQAKFKLHPFRKQFLYICMKMFFRLADFSYFLGGGKKLNPC